MSMTQTPIDAQAIPGVVSAIVNLSSSQRRERVTQCGQKKTLSRS